MRTTILLALNLLSVANPVLSQTSSGSPTVNLFLLDILSPLPTLKASVISADATRTAYYISCEAKSQPFATLAATDPCSLIGDASVTINPSAFELHVMRETVRISGTGLGTFTPEYFTTIKATVTCVITSNTASCTGNATSTITEKNSAWSGSETYSSVFPAVTAVQVPVVLTAGLSNIYTPTSTTAHSSTGGLPKVTQNAMLAGVAAIVGGVAMF
ncbi:hypothetical protein GQ53DRAFT_820433 [Thozetella sp. PMI_491]|nr:hypothetical protein GQ53DRAFT_820433 [Thozetella sp. PMI_491]